MFLDHDLDNLPRLDDETLEALADPYTVIPAVQSEEAIARRDTEHAADTSPALTIRLSPEACQRLCKAYERVLAAESMTDVAQCVLTFCAGKEHHRDGHLVTHLEVMRTLLKEVATDLDALGFSSMTTESPVHAAGGVSHA